MQTVRDRRGGAEIRDVTFGRPREVGRSSNAETLPCLTGGRRRRHRKALRGIVA